MMKSGFRRIIPAAAAILIFAVVLLLLSYFENEALPTSSATSLPITVIIDAGHGDFDPGALGTDGTQEKDLNLALALDLKALFEASGFQVVMSRENDATLADEDAVSIAAKKRSDTVNRAALASVYPNSVYLSIHQNAFSDRSQHGAQLFYGTLDSRSKLLCESIQQSIIELIQPDNKREIKQGTDNIFIMTHVNAPIALVECGFITNEEELMQLKDEQYRQKMVFAIFCGFCNYLETLFETGNTY